MRRVSAIGLAIVSIGLPLADTHAQSSLGSSFSAFSASTSGAPPATFAPPAAPAFGAIVPAPRAASATAPKSPPKSARPPAASASPPARALANRARQEELLAYAPAEAEAEPDPAPRAADLGLRGWLPGFGAISAPPPAAALAPAPVREAVPRPPAPIHTLRIGGRKQEVPGELAALIATKANKHGVPVELAHAVVTVESNYNPRAWGRGATIGLMQIKHPTARSLGFAGTSQELFEPAHNLEYGIKYLAEARRLARGDLCGTILRYQAGLRTTVMTPHAAGYCAKVKYLLGSTGMQRVASAPVGR